MDALAQGITALITATGIAVAGFIGISNAAPVAPVETKTSVVVTVCGSGGLVPPTPENKCSKP